MAVLRYKDVTKLQDKERTEKLKDLRLELVKSGLAANKTNAKTREIKKAIARLLTFENLKVREAPKK